MITPFEAYSEEHWLALLAAALIGVWLIWMGLRLNEKSRKTMGVCIAAVVLSSILIGDVLMIARGVYDVKLDLPLYLCRVVAWLLPFAIGFQWRKVLAVFYFWTIAGTLQALLTPDLAEGFPDYFYFRYWILHAGLVVAVCYSVIVFRLRVGWPDFWRAILWAQVYIVTIHIINVLIGSNYSYTINKPPNSILDYMGEWPWYLLTGQLLMIVLFLLCLVPFKLKTRSQTPG